MEERKSRLSSMVWRRFQQYFCVRLIPQNSMFANFCHVLKSNHNTCGDYYHHNSLDMGCPSCGILVSLKFLEFVP